MAKMAMQAAFEHDVELAAELLDDARERMDDGEFDRRRRLLDNARESRLRYEVRQQLLDTALRGVDADEAA